MAAVAPGFSFALHILVTPGKRCKSEKHGHSFCSSSNSSLTLFCMFWVTHFTRFYANIVRSRSLFKMTFCPLGEISTWSGIAIRAVRKRQIWMMVMCLFHLRNLAAKAVTIFLYVTRSSCFSDNIFTSYVPQRSCLCLQCCHGNTENCPSVGILEWTSQISPMHVATTKEVQSCPVRAQCSYRLLVWSIEVNTYSLD